MKLYTAGWNPEKLGGAHSFLRNFRKIFNDQLVDDPRKADIYFIPSISMLEKLSVIPKDKKIVVRIDNILKRSCNRDIYPFEGDKITMMEAMRFVCQRADLVIYQSQWAKELLDDYLKPKKSVVILNSVDESIFFPGAGIPTDKEIYFYSRSSNHDNKGWHNVYYYYQELHKGKVGRELWIAGRFSPENIPRNFDFFNGEKIRYLGFIQDPEAMALTFRTAKHFIYSYSHDCCSNTLIEALLSGTDVIYLEESGGAKEIKEASEKYGREYFYLQRMGGEYKEALQ